MNTCLQPTIFPQALTIAPRDEEPKFHGVSIPADSGAAEVFYQGLACVGWAARETCQQRPEANLDKVLELGLEALRRHVFQLQAAEPKDFETMALEKIQAAISKTYGDIKWRVPEPAAPIHTGPRDDSAAGARKPVILVADDCPVSRYLITKELEKAGMEAHVVVDGADALLMTPVCWPDLILMDVQMDRLDGVRTCSLLKQSQLVGHPAVIFLSGHSEKDAIVKGFAAGGADYIAKPFEPREGLARIRAHLQIRQLQVQIENSNHQLLRANVAKDRVLSVTSHDLRSPLTAIRGLTEYLQDGSLGPVTDRQAQTLKHLNWSIEGMLSLVNDLLDVSTLDDRTVKVERTPLDLAPMLRSVSWIFTPTAARKQINLLIDAPEIGLATDGDEARLKRVLENLLMNAIKFSPAQTIITLGARQENGLVWVWVDDQGPGVPAAEQVKLFTEYGRTTVQPTAGESSTGLGLAICRRIITAHGGAITMRNRVEGGSRFEFCLPEATPIPVAAEACVA